MISIFNGRKRTLGGETKDIYIQVNVDFRDHLYLFKGALLNVFMVIGLHADGDGWAFPNYALLAKETGYGADTIRRALADLCELRIDGHRVLLRYQPKSADGTFFSNHYLLFPSAEEVGEYEDAGVTHLANQSGGGFDRRGKNPPRSPSWEKPTTEKPTTKKNHHEEQPTDGGGGQTVDNLPAFEALIEIGVESSVASVLARTCDVDQVLGWCTYAMAATGLDSPPALVVARLRDGVPAPTLLEEAESSWVICPGCGCQVHQDDLCPDCGRCEYRCHDEEGECQPG